MTDFRTRLLAHEPLVGTLVTLPSPEIAEICADAGFDWLFLDMEHGSLGLDDVQRIIQAVGERCPCLVRVPATERLWVTRVLEIGVAGLILPQLTSAADVARVISYSKYPPPGTRSVGIGRAHRYGARFAEYLARANEDTAIVVQIEHIDAVRNLNEIIRVPGVDAILIGPFDLSASMGKPGALSDPEVQAALETVRARVSGAGMPIGIFSTELEGGKRVLASGYTLVPVATDALLLVRAARGAIQSLKS